LARPQPRTERCDLCAAALATEHEHLLERANRRLLCCCDSCALLLSGRQDVAYRRVPRRVQSMSDFRMTDAQWEDLHIPINLAFFFRSAPAGHIVALYPSPAGATESFLTAEVWRDLVNDNPCLADLEPEVEALLVNRLGEARQYFRLPIDQCFRLVGVLRTHWRGLSGGTKVWSAISQFLAELKRRSSSLNEVGHA
jgi:hypothetical protein